MSEADSPGFFRRNGLSLVLLLLFVVFLIGQAESGFASFNDERTARQQPTLTLDQYLHSGHFISATFENWESEFLQMGMYVLLTVGLRQRGSAESRPLDPASERQRIDPGPTPWPVAAGGVWRALYAHSLALVYAVLFALSFSLHAYGSWTMENEQRLLEGKTVISLAHHLRGPQFWFESLQNWQSEFLAVLSIVVLSIYLRQQDSPQSKATAAPHSQTGG
ncbi:DUF6766 family protein [Pseudoxanthomonas dokdonensis]|uniref:Membrane protein n=1 Tax=Pseudoxanthomonas dokdonensis TaxID=344882 RepID=A0A0R0CE58_9GAMM|nr:DUF6766 family protein [Pseudoxanthomonas dokdonensis]KRG68044.1 membrane protein [Pseudoxanthomonas dokdonensis]